MVRQALFRVIDPKGKAYEVFDDGSISGFPHGCVVVNRYPVLVRSEIARLRAIMADQQADRTVSGA